MPNANTRIQNGSLLLFRLFGIDVFLHWSWLIIAYFRIKNPIVQYDSQVWAIAEYLSLFGIVLLHEFGHALACKSVGGTAKRIILWPLGGVAYVSPPPRPGAVLWSLVAGPLVNVVLLPITIGLVALSVLFGGQAGLDQRAPAAPAGVERPADAGDENADDNNAREQAAPENGGNEAGNLELVDLAKMSDLHKFLNVLAMINLVLLVFNMLPVYPLDGGQIVQALLWFVIGRARSLMLVTAVSLVIGVAFIGFAAVLGDWWLVVLAVFVAITAWKGLQQSKLLVKLLNSPRNTDAACPSCRQSPPAGPVGGCGRCDARFDLFATGGVCPGCDARVLNAICTECEASHSLAEWKAAANRD